MSKLVWSVFATVAGSAAFAGSVELWHTLHTKEKAFEDALALAADRGIINLGAGPHRTWGAYNIAHHPDVYVNVDIAPDGLPNLIQLDIERDVLPYEDKAFGCAFASHVIEHLNNWKFALGEMVRVADHVVLVLPHPTCLIGWISPEHRQHFSEEDIDDMMNLYPNVTVYY